MCSPPCINQTIPKPSFDFTKGPFPGRRDDPLHKKQKTEGKKEVSKRKVLALYEDYLKKRVKETWPNGRIGTRLFEEIKAKGYRGSFVTMKKFLGRVRKECEFPKETSLSYYKGYIKKSLEEAQPNCVSARTLFNEITAEGYRGSFSAVEKLVWVIRKQTKMPKEASIQFHKEYLIKRVKEAYPKYAIGTELFKEIRARGYQGTLKTVRLFLVPIRKSIQETKANRYRGALSPLQTILPALREQIDRPSEACVEFYRDYLTKRLEDTYPSFVSGKELFKEIRAKGYRGALSTLQAFLPLLRKQTEGLSEACVRFHKEYLSKRIKDALPDFVPTQKLFEEITDRGYRGAFSTLQVFLSTLRRQEESLGKGLEVHQNYLIKRLEKPRIGHTKQLFEETTEKRTLSTSKPHKNDLPKQLDRVPLVGKNVLPEASLQFHKEYLIKILQETWPSCLPPEQLFKEIISRGYRGTYKEVEVFLMMISK